MQKYNKNQEKQVIPWLCIYNISNPIICYSTKHHPTLLTSDFLNILKHEILKIKDVEVHQNPIIKDNIANT